MILPRTPWSLPGLVFTLPDPEILLKYGQITVYALKKLREKARLKGMEHRQKLEDLV